jgi:hypothetical protein
MGVGITISGAETMCPTMATLERRLFTPDLVSRMLYQRRDAFERVELSLVEIQLGGVEVEFPLQETHDLKHVQGIDSPGEDQGIRVAEWLGIPTPIQNISYLGADLFFSFHNHLGNGANKLIAKEK